MACRQQRRYADCTLQAIEGIAPMAGFIAYYRVSTQRQGGSGLGLEAQQHAVKTYLGADPTAEFVEVESGKSDKNRPQLALAIAACKKQKATLVIAKLDRLSRNASFLLMLRDSSVDVKACDMPNAGTLEFGIRAIIAQHEREEISKRTKDALGAAKRRGTVLGKTGAALAQRHKDNADAFTRSIADKVKELHTTAPTVRGLCAALNEAGIMTAKGNRWHVTSTQKLLTRLATI